MKSNIYFKKASKGSSKPFLFLLLFILAMYLFLALVPFRETGLNIQIGLAGSMGLMVAFLGYMNFLRGREESWMSQDGIICSTLGLLPTCKKMPIDEIDEVEVKITNMMEDPIVTSAEIKAATEQISRKIDQAMSQIASYSDFPKKWRHFKIDIDGKKYEVRLFISIVVLKNIRNSRKLKVLCQNYSRFETLFKALKKRKPLVKWRFDGFSTG